PQKQAAQVLKTESYPKAVVEFDISRIAWNLREGDPFKLSWGPEGIVGMVCRVTRVGLGELVKGEIHVNAVKDIFGVGWTAYTPPSPTGWVDPISMPQAPTAEALVETPYASIASADRHVMTLAARALTGVALGYQV